MSRAGGLDSGGTGGASYALEDALDEPFIESDANSDGEPQPAEAGRSAEQTMIGGISGLELSDASSLAVGQVVDDLPSGCTRRASQQHAHHELTTFGFCPWESAQSVKRSCKAKRDFFLLNPPIKGDIVFLLFGMAVGEPPRQDPGALKEQATQLRGLCGSYRRGGLIVSRYAAWSRSWQLLASTLSSCWLVK